MRDEIRFILIFVIITIILLFLIFYNKAKENILTPEYGFFSDPITTDCSSGSSFCNEYGSYNVIRNCIPNPNTGLGCIDDDPLSKNYGKQMYGTQVVSKGCVPQCRSKVLQVKEDLEVKYASKFTGLDIPFPRISLGCDDGSYVPYTTKTYECVTNDGEGIYACNYTCGSEDVISFFSSQRGEGGKDGKIDISNYPIEYIAGVKTSVCYAEEDVLGAPYNQIQPNSVLPLKCYSKNKMMVTTEDIDPSTGKNLVQEKRELIVDFTKFKSPSRCYEDGILLRNGTVISLNEGEVMTLYQPVKESNPLPACNSYGVVINKKFLSCNNQEITPSLKSNCYVNSAQRDTKGNPVNSIEDIFKGGFTKKPLFCISDTERNSTNFMNNFSTGNVSEIPYSVKKSIDTTLFNYSCFGVFSSDGNATLLNEKYTSFPKKKEDIINLYNGFFSSPGYAADVLGNLGSYSSYNVSGEEVSIDKSFYLPCYFCDTTGLFMISSNLIPQEGNIINQDFQQNTYQTYKTPLFLDMNIIRDSIQFGLKQSSFSSVEEDYINLNIIKFYHSPPGGGSSSLPGGNVMNGFSIFYMRFDYSGYYDYSGCKKIKACGNFNFKDCTPGNEFFLFYDMEGDSSGETSQFYFFEFVEMTSSDISIPSVLDETLVPSRFIGIKQKLYPSGNVEIPIFTQGETYYPGSLYYKIVSGSKVYYYISEGGEGSPSVINTLSFDPLRTVPRLSINETYFLQPMSNIFNTIDDLPSISISGGGGGGKILFTVDEEDINGNIFTSNNYDCAEPCIYYESGLDTSEYLFNSYLDCISTFIISPSFPSGGETSIKRYLGIKYIPCKKVEGDNPPETLMGIFGDCGGKSSDDLYTQELFGIGMTSSSGAFFSSGSNSSGSNSSGGDCDVLMKNFVKTANSFGDTYTLFKIANLMFNYISPIGKGSYADVVYGSSSGSAEDGNLQDYQTHQYVPLMKCKIYTFIGMSYKTKLYFSKSRYTTSLKRKNVDPNGNANMRDNFLSATAEYGVAGNQVLTSTNDGQNFYVAGYDSDTNYHLCYNAKESFSATASVAEPKTTSNVGGSVVEDDTLCDTFVILSTNYSSTSDRESVTSASQNPGVCIFGIDEDGKTYKLACETQEGYLVLNDIKVEKIASTSDIDTNASILNTLRENRYISYGETDANGVPNCNNYFEQNVIS